MHEVLFKVGGHMEDIELLFTVTKVQGYIAFSRGTPSEVIQHWQAALNDMKQDGSFAAIHAKWLPGDMPPGLNPEPIVMPTN